MNREDMLRLLGELGDYLAENGCHAILDIYGGSAIALAYSDSRVSQDIDCIIAGSTNYETFRQAIAEIGRRNALGRDWLNEQVLPIIENDFILSRMNVFGKNKGLEIRVPDAEFLLASKLYSARLQAKDLEDALKLARTTGNTSRTDLEVVLKKYVRPEAIRTQNRKPGRHNCIWKFIDIMAAELRDC
ncbi:MAG: hypothetical protein LBS10_09875 [Gracilibacteraceae bacterium]|jgi:hypothetical protein|nr:hypothetical protein [Gracilibacteraceae bacterium]